MLLHTRGVITEKRFQDMTPAQWMFHYMAIKKKEKEKMDTNLEILVSVTERIEKSLRSASELNAMILNRSEFAAYFKETKHGKKAYEDQLNQDKQAFDQIMSDDSYPDVLKVEVDMKEEKSPLKTISRRKIGINISPRKEDD